MTLRKTFFLTLTLLLSTVSTSFSGDDGGDHLRIRVEGMHCQSCVSMVRKTVRKIDGVDNVSVNLEKGIVEVVCDSSEARRQPITEAIQKMGYKVVAADSSVTVSPDSVHSPGH